MATSLENLLEQTATRGTWYGGGSAAALSCASSAALLEKLSQPPDSVPLRKIRFSCLRLIEKDAKTFSFVIRAYSKGDREQMQKALKSATEVPWQIFQYSKRLISISNRIRRIIRPRYRVDLECAVFLAKASKDSARALVKTNIDWLGKCGYSSRMRLRLSKGK